MAVNEGDKEEDKFDFDTASEVLGYNPLRQTLNFPGSCVLGGPAGTDDRVSP